MSDDPFVLRPVDDGDMNFIRSSWMNEFYQHGQRWSRADHAPIRDALIERADILVASLADVKTSVCGWACTEPGIVHFVVVKERWRRHGIAKRLLAGFFDLPSVVYTHRTEILRRLSIPKTWHFNPYAVIGGKNDPVHIASAP